LQIRKKYPQAKLILLTDRNIAEGIRPFKLFDEFWITESGNIFSVLKDTSRFLFKTWKMKNLWVADLEVYSKLTTVFALMTFALNRFGFYLGPVFFRKYLNTHNILFDRKGFLEDNYWHMAEAITGEHAKMQPIYQANSVSGGSKQFIALNNTCSDLAPQRKLPDQTFIKLCEWVLENTSYDLALLGAASDKEYNDRIVEGSESISRQKTRVFNFAGAKDFESYYHFLAVECKALVTIDSGPLHMARALGLPTLSIWGPTNPANYLKIFPGEEKHLYHYQQAHCSPCVHYHRQLPCGGNNFCMKDIETKQLTEKIKILLRYSEVC
jgi:ADP-heptose:LPS heptosyltransferase